MHSKGSKVLQADSEISRIVPYMALLAVCMLFFLVKVSYTSINIALVKISHDIHVELNTLQWLLSGYVLAWAGAAIFGGQLADVYGRIKITMIGVAIFTGASLFCLFAENIQGLIAGRILQGIGAALFTPSLYTIAFCAFEKEKQGVAIGFLAMSSALGVALGPTLGGTITEFLSWRAIFLFKLPLCIIALALLSMVAIIEKKNKKNNSEEVKAKAKKLDLLGATLLIPALVLITYGFNQIETWGLKNPYFYGTIGSGILLLIVFWKLSSQKN